MAPKTRSATRKQAAAKASPRKRSKATLAQAKTDKLETMDRAALNAECKKRGLTCGGTNDAKRDKIRVHDANQTASSPASPDRAAAKVAKSKTTRRGRREKAAGKATTKTKAKAKAKAKASPNAAPRTPTPLLARPSSSQPSAKSSPPKVPPSSPAPRQRRWPWTPANPPTPPPNQAPLWPPFPPPPPPPQPAPQTSPGRQSNRSTPSRRRSTTPQQNPHAGNAPDYANMPVLGLQALCQVRNLSPALDPQTMIAMLQAFDAGSAVRRARVWQGAGSPLWSMGSPPRMVGWRIPTVEEVDALSDYETPSP